MARFRAVCGLGCLILALGLVLIHSPSLAQEKGDTQLAVLAGEWKITYTNDAVREYTIETDGKVSGTATGQIKRKDAMLLLTFTEMGTDKLERFTLKSDGRLFVEHYAPKSDFPDKKPAGIGIGIRTAFSQSPFKGDWHIESKAVSHLQATLSYSIHAPNIVAREWIAFAAVPPDLPSQKNVKATIRGGTTITELSELKRPVLFARIPVSAEEVKRASANAFHVQVDYQATLFARKLVAGKPSSPVQSLSKVARENWLAATPTCDFKSREFRAWIEKHSLHRGSSERDLEFAFRVLQGMRKELDYKSEVEQKRQASQVCQDKWSDCGGISNLYVAALRANNVPARCLPGRGAKSGEGDSAECHVTTEFFAESIGWIPVEITSAVSFKKSPDLNFFGRDDGTHLTFHTDTDLILDTKVAGNQTVPFGQWVHYWVDGTGAWKDHTRKVKWQVQLSPVR